MKKLGLMVDCSRNSVFSVDAAKRLINIMSTLGYTYLELYTEDTYTVDGEPRFGAFRGRYSKAEIREIDGYALSKGIILKPCIQTLGHLESIFRWDEYKVINDCANILLCDNERTYELIENMFRSVSECFTCREINIGMDEAFLVGQGKYYREHGHVPQIEVMRRHLLRVLEIANKYGFTCDMWGDLFYDMAYSPSYPDASVEKAAAAILENVNLIYWDYYNTERKHYNWRISQYQKLTDRLSFAAGAWTWCGYAPGNVFAMKATKEAFIACEEKGIDDFFITLWGDDGGEHTAFAALPLIVAVSEYAKGNYDRDRIADRFFEVVGIDHDLFFDLGLPNRFNAEDLKHPVNVVNQLLFNDPFLGLCNKTVKTGGREYFERIEKRLREGVINKEWGYIFEMECSLCRALALKCDLGLRTRALYSADDKDGLRAIANSDYKECIRLIREFRCSLKSFWDHDKKMFGFEVQDLRIGGILMRLEACAEALIDYADGRLGCIPQLDETPSYLFDKTDDIRPAYFKYENIVTTNKLSHI